MQLYILVTLTTIAIAFLIKNQEKTVWLEGAGKVHSRKTITRRQGLNVVCLGAIFALLFLLSALRLEVGNDYGTYVDTIHEIYVGGYVVTEPLFNGVVKLLCDLSGGENYLLVFAVFAFATIAIFLNVLYRQCDHFLFGFFLFMTLGIYFRTFNTVRYYFVLALTLYSFRYVLRREYPKFILLIGLAALFHKSVLVVIPLYLLAALPWKKWSIAVLAVLGAAALVLREQIIRVALFLYPSYRDTIYLETESGLEGSLLTIVRCLLVLVLALFCYRESIEGKKENRFYFQLNLLAIGLYTFGSFLPLVGRIGYYLITSHMLFIPALLEGIQEKRRKRLLTILIVLACLIYFGLFLRTADQEGIRVLPYKSWLFYEKDFLNAGEIF